MTIHVVQPGETVASIAAGYGVDPVRLATDNSVDRGQLAVGQTLVIRFPRRVHAVPRATAFPSGSCGGTTGPWAAIPPFSPGSSW